MTICMRTEAGTVAHPDSQPRSFSFPSRPSPFTLPALTWVLLLASVATAVPSFSPPLSATPLGSLYGERPVEILPTDHWAYEELRKLWIAGTLDSFFVSTRPVSRYDVAAVLLSLEERGLAPVGSPPMERLLREFSREMRYLREGTVKRRLPGAEETPFVFQSRSRELDFRASLYADAAFRKQGEGDVDVEEGSRMGARVAAILTPGIVAFEDVYVGKRLEAWRYSEELFGLEDVVILSDRFYVSVRTPFFDAAAGRDRLRWGPGRSGTMLLSDSAPTYTLLSASKTIGKTFKISTLSAILDSQEGKYLAAHRLDIVPAGFLQIGLSETAVYHSRHIEPLYVISLVPFTFVERLLHRDSQDPRPDDPLRNNLALGADVAVRPTRGVSLYGELMLDDVSEETGERPTRLAYQLGTNVSVPRGGRNFNLVAELSRVWNYTYSVCYTAFYDRDHSHQGVPLGHYLGPDARNVLVLASCDISRDVEAGVAWDETSRGQGALEEPWCEAMGEVKASELSGVVETARRTSVFLRWLPRDNVRLETSAGYEEVKNERNIEGQSESGPLFSVSLAARW